jgi:hypothetical protein
VGRDKSSSIGSWSPANIHATRDAPEQRMPDIGQPMRSRENGDGPTMARDPTRQFKNHFAS